MTTERYSVDPRMVLRIKVERIKRGLSQTQLGAAANIAASDISRIETGRFRPYKRQLARLARVLKLKPEQLLEAVD
jgi:transcriptional regulator with XRE-family HTH domain